MDELPAETEPPDSAAVVGLDLSLTSTGIADNAGTRLIRSKAKGIPRLIDLRELIIGGCVGAGLVMIEDYAFSRHEAYAHALGELGGVIRVGLWEAGIPYCDVKATSLKLYATGKGNSSKEAVLASGVVRSGIEFQNTDECEAWWLRAIGTDLLAATYGIGTPTVVMPAKNRSALAALALPPAFVSAGPRVLE